MSAGGGGFEIVAPGWPKRASVEAGLDRLTVQYELLLSRVRKAARSRLSRREGWWQTEALVVAPLRVGPRGAALARWICKACERAPEVRGNKALAALSRALEWSVAAKLSELLGEAESMRFKTTPNVMLPCSGGRARSRRGPQRGLAAWSRVTPGSVSAYFGIGSVGKLVRVEGVVEKIDASAVSASIDCDKYFTLPSAMNGAPDAPRGKPQGFTIFADPWERTKSIANA